MCMLSDDNTHTVRWRECAIPGGSEPQVRGPAVASRHVPCLKNYASHVAVTIGLPSAPSLRLPASDTVLQALT